MNVKNLWWVFKGKYVVELSDLGVKATKCPLNTMEEEGNYVSWEEILGLSLNTEIKEDA